jgi:hypothetical protein
MRSMTIDLDIPVRFTETPIQDLPCHYGSTPRIRRSRAHQTPHLIVPVGRHLSHARQARADRAAGAIALPKQQKASVSMFQSSFGENWRNLLEKSA